MITTSSLTRQFGSRTVVEDVTLDVRRGEIVGLLGPNGAGKTTTLRMLAGLIAPTSGSVTIDGTPLTRSTGNLLRTRIGFLTEMPGLWDRLTVRENLLVYARLYPLRDSSRVVDRALARFDLADRADTRAAELSKGMRQKVALARALVHEPTVLLLDEPTSGLDPEVTRSVRRLLEERRAAGCAIIVSTHNLDEAERLSDRVAVLQRRLIALDAPAALRRRLTSGITTIRLTGAAADHLTTARTFDVRATADGSRLLVSLADAERDVPALVKALVATGAAIVEVRTDAPHLEDVYVQLMATRERESVE